VGWERALQIEERLQALGISLPNLRTPIGNFVPAKRVGDLLFLSGRGPTGPDGRAQTGKVGGTVTVDEAYQHARQIGIGLLGVMKSAVGDLDRIDEIVKVFGMVNAGPDFMDHPKVINGCSDLFVEVFGEKGRHARSAVGMSSLPFQITVEIEAIALVR
jgi:enamine deaminase RidA (YjgF/YER057c/UK114 family)